MKSGVPVGVSSSLGGSAQLFNLFLTTKLSLAVSLDNCLIETIDKARQLAFVLGDSLQKIDTVLYILE